MQDILYGAPFYGLKHIKYGWNKPPSHQGILSALWQRYKTSDLPTWFLTKASLFHFVKTEIPDCSKIWTKCRYSEMWFIQKAQTAEKPWQGGGRIIIASIFLGQPFPSCITPQHADISVRTHTRVHSDTMCISKFPKYQQTLRSAGDDNARELK